MDIMLQKLLLPKGLVPITPWLCKNIVPNHPEDRQSFFPQSNELVQ